MKRLKIVLQSKIFYTVLSICTIFYVLICTKIIEYHSVFEDGIAEVAGKVINYSASKDKLTIVIKSDEKIKVNFYIEDKIPNVEIGDVIKVRGKITTPSNNTIPNTFNYKKYLYNQKIYKVMNADSITVEKDNLNVINKIKNYIYKRSSFNEYISMFIIGDKANLDSSVYDGCKSIGVAHLLAISGMHISVFVAILSRLLKRINKNISHIFISVFLIFYAYIVNFSASILRVVIGYMLRMCCDLLDLKLNSYYILGLTAVVILWINPFFIYQISFIYSFTAVFSIVYTSKYLKGKYLSDLLIISFWTLLFSLPITINLNYEINLISLVANLFLIPFVTFCLYPLSLVCFIIPIFTCVFQVFTKIMELFVLVFSKIEIFTINIPKLGWGVIIIYYIFLLLLVYFNYKRLFLLLIVLIGCVKYGNKFDKSYKVNFLDVGQGDSSLIITPYFEKTILIDTGGVISFNENSSNYLSNNLILYFKSIGIKKINYLLISHGDYDHMGEAINLVNIFKVEKVIFNCGEYNDLEQDLIKVLNKKKIPYYSCIKELNIADNKLHFLNDKNYGNENDNSSVIYTELNNYKFLFMGDSGIDVEEDLIEKYNLNDIDVLKVGHHGSKTSSSKEFIDTINPKYSIISVGKNNRYGHPNKEVLNNLGDSKTYRTDQDGSVMFKIKNNKLQIETCAP